MDSINAFAKGEANRNKEQMVFDWEKAAKLIKEKKPILVRAGLADDWEYTGGTIFQDGEPVMDSYTFLASTWAIPEIDIDGQIENCYRMISKAPEWDSKTKWPPEALEILKNA